MHITDMLLNYFDTNKTYYTKFRKHNIFVFTWKRKTCFRNVV